MCIHRLPNWLLGHIGCSTSFYKLEHGGGGLFWSYTESLPYLLVRFAYWKDLPPFVRMEGGHKDSRSKWIEGHCAQLQSGLAHDLERVTGPCIITVCFLT